MSVDFYSSYADEAKLIPSDLLLKVSRSCRCSIKVCSSKLKFISPAQANFLITNNSAGEVCS